MRIGQFSVENHGFDCDNQPNSFPLNDVSTILNVPVNSCFLFVGTSPSSSTSVGGESWSSEPRILRPRPPNRPPGYLIRRQKVGPFCVDGFSRYLLWHSEGTFWLLHWQIVSYFICCRIQSHTPTSSIFCNEIEPFTKFGSKDMKYHIYEVVLVYPYRVLILCNLP